MVEEGAQRSGERGQQEGGGKAGEDRVSQSTAKDDPDQVSLPSPIELGGIAADRSRDAGTGEEVGKGDDRHHQRVQPESVGMQLMSQQDRDDQRCRQADRAVAEIQQAPLSQVGPVQFPTRLGARR